MLQEPIEDQPRSMTHSLPMLRESSVVDQQRDPILLILPLEMDHTAGNLNFKDDHCNQK